MRLSVRDLSNLERGVRRLPQHATITLLAEALQLAGPDWALLEAAGPDAHAHKALHGGTLGTSGDTLKTWSQTFGWVARVALHDAEPPLTASALRMAAARRVPAVTPAR